ncbi:MAG: ATP-dependent Clp protease adaptor ClpS [Planctomycetia bacterium]|nr:ATP-dependent Clp protease adaptor ClpS [Planctomycetia bacterium]
MEKIDTTTVIREKPKNRQQEKVCEKSKSKNKPKRLPQYRVMLWNDDDHSFEYVIRMMRSIFGYDKTRGMIIACGVHACGKTPVAVLPLEVAELRREQIRQFGPDPLIEGSISSMYATLEPIEEEK